MMDLEETEPLSKKEEERGCESNNETKSCKDCKTTKTPLWRSGPAGPKSLCNACGIRYRKKRSSMVGLDLDGKIPSSTKKKEKAHLTTSGGMGGRESLKMRFLVWGKEVILQRAPPAALSLSSLSSLGVVKKQRCQRRRKLKEEEMAAFSLMALSCGSVFA